MVTPVMARMNGSACAGCDILASLNLFRSGKHMGVSCGLVVTFVHLSSKAIFVACSVVVPFRKIGGRLGIDTKREKRDDGTEV